MTGAPHVRLSGVSQRYDKGPVLTGIDLSIASGEFCSVVGPSGCGKSTLLRIILGEEAPATGEVEIDGQPGGPPDVRRGIVQQGYSLFPHLTVFENVAFAARMRQRRDRTPDAEVRRGTMDLLDRVRMADHAARYPTQLSGGMRQRVAIVQALASNPRILLMDEPFAALDPTSREDLQVYLLSLWEERRMTVFFVTHDITEALFLGTRIVVLSNRGEPGPSRAVMDRRLAHAASRLEDKDAPWFRALREEVIFEGFPKRAALRQQAPAPTRTDEGPLGRGEDR